MQSITIRFVYMILWGGVALAPSPGGDFRDKEYKECCANLLIIRDAINEFRKQRKDLPAKLSDLRPLLNDGGRLFCPIARREGITSVDATSNSQSRQNDTQTSYSYEFSSRVHLAAVSGRTMREFKERQMGIVGSRVPIVRCDQHGEDRFLNLPFEGELYESRLRWEELFEGRIVEPGSLDETVVFGRRNSDAIPDVSRIAPPRVVVIPQRDPEMDKLPAVNITKYNASLSPSWDPAFPGNDLANLGPGKVSLKGIAFDARGIIQLASKTKFRDEFRNRCDGIPVGTWCSKLYFLHGCAHGDEKHLGETVASFRAHLAGEEDAEQKIIYGTHVLDWWATPTEELEKAVAWNGENARSSIRLYLTTLDLGARKFVRTIDFSSASTKAAPFLVAISFAE